MPEMSGALTMSYPAANIGREARDPCSNSCLSARAYALRSLAPGGVCTGAGCYFAKKTPLPLMQMYADSSALHVGVSHPRADLPVVLELFKTGSFRPQRITTVVSDWDDAPKAFLERTTKVVVKREPLSQTQAPT